MIPKLRATISKDRNRYRFGNWDLDLTYITNRLIAMSFPARGFESAYRNDITEVSRMLRSHHPQHFRIWNLSERPYDYSLFDYEVLDMGWPDHHSPPLRTLLQIMVQMHDYLSRDVQNVAIVHCVAAGSLVTLAEGIALPVESFQQLKWPRAVPCMVDGELFVEGVVTDSIVQQPRPCVRVALDHGEALVVTPDHRVLAVLDGSTATAPSFVEAQLLVPGVSRVVCSAVCGVADEPANDAERAQLFTSGALEARLALYAACRLVGIYTAPRSKLCSAAAAAADAAAVARLLPRGAVMALATAWRRTLMAEQDIDHLSPSLLREIIAAWWSHHCGNDGVDPRIRIVLEEELSIARCVKSLLASVFGITARLLPPSSCAAGTLEIAEEHQLRFLTRVGVRYDVILLAHHGVLTSWLRAQSCGPSVMLYDYCRSVGFEWGGFDRTFFVRVRGVDEYADGVPQRVYDLSVPAGSNFVANGVVVHNCMAGKGRTGTVISSFLLYSGIVKNAAEAVREFGRARSALELGVEQPSQKRYVFYLDAMLRSRVYPRIVHTVIRRIELGPPPPVCKVTHSLKLLLQIFSTSEQPETLLYSNSWLANRADEAGSKDLVLPSFFPSDRVIVLDVAVPVHGDITIRGFHVTAGGKIKPIFRCAFHTAFIDHDELMFGKGDVDLAYKNRRFDDDFFLRVQFDSSKAEEYADPLWSEEMHRRFLGSVGLFAQSGSCELTPLAEDEDGAGSGDSPSTLDSAADDFDDFLDIEQALDVIQMNLMDMPAEFVDH